MPAEWVCELSDVRRAFDDSADELGLRANIPQRDLKELTILAVDRICHRLRLPDVKLVMCANRTSESLPDKLRATELFCARFVDVEGRVTKKSAESMVDVHVSFAGPDGGEPFHAVCTAESEGYHAFGAKESSTSNDNGYLWDLYKLLQVPSPIRLFVARVHPTTLATLEKRVAHLVAAYAPVFRANDRVFSLLIPSTSNRAGRYEDGQLSGWLRADAGGVVGLD